MRYKLFQTKLDTNNGIVAAVSNGSVYLDYNFSEYNGSYIRPIGSYHRIEFWYGKFLKFERI